MSKDKTKQDAPDGGYKVTERIETVMKPPSFGSAPKPFPAHPPLPPAPVPAHFLEAAMRQNAQLIGILSDAVGGLVDLCDSMATELAEQKRDRASMQAAAVELAQIFKGINEGSPKDGSK